MTREISKKVLSVTIDIDLYEKIDKICELQGDTRSAFVERALQHIVDEKEEYLADMEKSHNRLFYDMMNKAPEKFIYMAAKFFGENVTEEDLTRIRKNSELYAAEGKKRQQQKKTSNKKTANKGDVG